MRSRPPPLRTRRNAIYDTMRPPASSSPAQAQPNSRSGRILLGYWHNWQSREAAFLPLRDVSPLYDVIHVAFAASDPAGGGRMLFSPYGYESPDRFRSELRCLQGMGKKVVLSIGGANGSPLMADRAAAGAFAASVRDLVEEYGFDGIDINLERSIALVEGDTDIAKPSSPSVRHLIEAVRAVRTGFGPDFVLSLTPEAVSVQGGHRAYRGPQGAYLPVIQGLRDILTYLQVQHYNAAPILALDGRLYRQGTADFLVALADMLLRGFALRENPGQSFEGLSPEKLVIGLPASFAAARGGFTPPAEVSKAFDYLAWGKAFGGRYVLGNGRTHPADSPAAGGRAYASVVPAGVMLWSINWDAAGSCRSSRSLRACLDRLP
jgi:chitinase